MRWKGFLILLIAWIVIIPLYTWTASLPNSLDYYYPLTTLFLLLIFATVIYPLFLKYKFYQKKLKNISKDNQYHLKIDKTSLLIALIISIILTFLLLSTYEHTENGVTEKGVGWHLIEGLSDDDTSPVLLSLMFFSSFFFCFELLLSYLTISIISIRKKIKNYNL